MRFDNPYGSYSLHVAKQCAAQWDEMEVVDGDRVHFCNRCSRNVFNVSALTKQEADALVKEHEGNLCVRYYQRADGSLVTTDVPCRYSISPRQPVQLRDAYYYSVMGQPGGEVLTPRQHFESIVFSVVALVLLLTPIVSAFLS